MLLLQIYDQAGRQSGLEQYIRARPDLFGLISSGTYGPVVQLRSQAPNPVAQLPHLSQPSLQSTESELVEAISKLLNEGPKSIAQIGIILHASVDPVSFKLLKERFGGLKVYKRAYS